MSADLDALLTCLYVLVDDLLPARRRFGRPPRISDSELICLAIAQVLLDCPNERRFLRLSKRGSAICSPTSRPVRVQQTAARARAAALAGDHAVGQAVALVLRPAPPARLDPGALRGLTRDRPPLRPGRDRRLRLLPLAQPLVLGLPPLPALPPDGLPIGFELAPANAPERAVAAELLERVLQPGQTVICDKGFAGADFEQHIRSLGATILRPDRKDEQPRFGSLGGIRQLIESTFDTLKDQLSLERHGGRTLTGLISRIARRLLALTAVILHNWQLGTPGRNLTAYDH